MEYILLHVPHILSQVSSTHSSFFIPVSRGDHQQPPTSPLAAPTSHHLTRAHALLSQQIQHNFIIYFSLQEASQLRLR